MGLVSLEVAKEHLRPPGDIDDDRIVRMIEEASDIVLDYVKAYPGDYLTDGGSPIPGEVPGRWRAACLLVLGSLYDNADGQNKDKEPLSDAVKSLLHSSRMPSIA